MNRKRDLMIGAMFIALLVMLGVGEMFLERTATAEQNAAVQAPKFEVDPMWPKPLPNGWLIGSAIGVSVDSEDHVWMIHRPDTLTATEVGNPTGTCCSMAPPVLEFDQEGNLINSWGGPGEGYEWPQSNHGMHIDHLDNVWIGGNGGRDSHILKFTQAGKFLMQIGKAGQPRNSNDTANGGGVAKVFVDPATNEVYVADGYGNRRVIVFDGGTGAYKRHWGAYGNVPDDTNIGRYNPDAPVAQQFRTPVHCAEVSNDGFVYVCDRSNDRIQVFRKDGAFVKETFVARRTLGDGSVWEIAFSKDPEQKYMYVADGANERIYVMLRDSLETVTMFGAGGRQPGQFYAVHSIATDSKGNIYTTETYEGKRLQKFTFKGLAPVTKMDQGTPWPTSNQN